MSKIYCHMGNPKVFSTSIQSFLTENSGKSFKYLGFRPSSNVNDWYEDDYLSDILNYNLRYMNKAYFQDEIATIREYFAHHYDECLISGKDLWISSENLSMKFIIEDIDPLEKFERLQSILPPQTTFIILFRNIWDSLISIWFEYVKNGYTKTYDDFCKEAYLWRQSNFLQSLFPESFLTCLSTNLINGNKIEYLIVNRGSGPSGVLDFFNKKIKVQNKEFPHCNRKYSTEKILHLRNKNLSETSYMDGTGLVETHRSHWSLRNEEEFDQTIWSKLRIQSRNRTDLKPVREFSIDFDQTGSRLYEYIMERRDRFKTLWEL